MLYTTVEALVGTEREAVGDGWRSRRFILAEDGFPFSVHETTVESGTVLHLKYRKHSETVYCVTGEAEVDDLGSGQVLPICPGTLYSARIGDDHVLRILQTTRFICIFEPPLHGQEEAD